MKILVFGLSSQHGGVESFIINQCIALRAAYDELDFEFIAFDSIPGYADCLVDEGFEFHIVPNRVRSPLGNYLTLKKIVDEGDFDCLWYHVCTLSDITLLKVASGAIPMRIVHSHNSMNMGNAINGVLHRRHKKVIGRYATDYLACSSNAAAFMFPQSALRDHEARIVTNGIDVDRFQFDEGARSMIRASLGIDDELVICTVGRMHTQKNPLFMLEVIRRMKEEDRRIRFLYLGDGPMRNEIERRIQELSLEGVVELLDSVENVQDYLSAADVFILPSLFEGLPFAAVEAQASGLRVLMSDSISREAVLSDHVSLLPLDENVWVDSLNDLQGFKCDRACAAEVIRNAGFDVRDNVRTLGKWLLQRCK